MKVHFEKSGFSTGEDASEGRGQAIESMDDSRPAWQGINEGSEKVFHRRETRRYCPTVENQGAISRYFGDGFSTRDRVLWGPVQPIEPQWGFSPERAIALSTPEAGIPPLRMCPEKRSLGKSHPVSHPAPGRLYWKKVRKWTWFYHRPGFSTGVFLEAHPEKRCDVSTRWRDFPQDARVAPKHLFSTVLVENGVQRPGIAIGKVRGVTPIASGKRSFMINRLLGYLRHWKKQTVSVAGASTPIPRWKTKPFSNTNRRLGKTCYTARRRKPEPQARQNPLRCTTRGPNA
ncbi:MAG: hypothetical protein ACYCRH_08195 [Acidiferrobacteraceae bacterium]